MNAEDLQRLCRAELIEIVLRQQAEIHRLQTTLIEMADAARSREGRAEPATIQQQQREQATRDALRHLDDPDYLAWSFLAQLMARAHEVWPEGPDLQQALYRAIEALRPAENPAQPFQQSRRYNILRLTYLDRQRPAEVAQTLAISVRQYYRDLKVAIQAVAGQVLGPEL